MFDENGDRKGLTQIEQLQGNKEVKVGVYDPTLKRERKIIWDEQQPVIWPGLTIQQLVALYVYIRSIDPWSIQIEILSKIDRERNPVQIQ